MREIFASIAGPGTGNGSGPALTDGLPEYLAAETRDAFSGFLSQIENIVSNIDSSDISDCESEIFTTSYKETAKTKYGAGFAFETQVTCAVVHPQAGEQVTHEVRVLSYSEENEAGAEN